MVHRFALFGGAIAAMGILLLALGAGNLFARADPGADGASNAAPAAAPTARVQVDTVYVKPAPTQKVIHVTQPAPPSARQTPRVVVINKPRHGGGDDGGHGDGGDQGGDD
jgi:hypothetical protein